jgi:ornithine decarboxylase
MTFAKTHGVNITTFDSECELRKIASHFPECKLVMRIRADDPNARCPLGNKYGAEEHDWDILLFTARSLALDIVGISFHVGSYASSPKVFSMALTKAKKALRLAKEHGFKPKIIDIGGGFSHAHGLPKNIKCSKNITLWAEPGRYFAELLMSLHTPIIGTKGTGVTIGESLYGGFSCIGMDHASPHVSKVLDEFGNEIHGEPVKMTIFGSSCDGSDIIYKEYELPHGTGYGSTLVWENMGAYTTASATNFNGLGYNSINIRLAS